MDSEPVNPRKASRLTAWLLAVFVALSLALGAEVWILRHDLIRLHRESDSEKAASQEQVRALRVQVIDPQTGYTAIDQELVNRAGLLLTPDQPAVLRASQTVVRQRNLFFQNLNKVTQAQAAGQ